MGVLLLVPIFLAIDAVLIFLVIRVFCGRFDCSFGKLMGVSFMVFLIGGIFAGVVSGNTYSLWSLTFGRLVGALCGFAACVDYKPDDAYVGTFRLKVVLAALAYAAVHTAAAYYWGN